MTDGEFKLQALYGQIRWISDERNRLEKENMELRRKLAHYMVGLKNVGYVICDNCGDLIDATSKESYYTNGVRKICAKCLFNELSRKEDDEC